MGLFTVELFTTFARRCGLVYIGEVLVCRRDTRNRHDPFGVATCKGTDSSRTHTCIMRFKQLYA